MKIFLTLLFISQVVFARLTNPIVLEGRNKIQNGDMRIDQRNEGTAIAVGTTAILDRWIPTKANTTATLTAQRVTSSVPAGFTYAQKFTLTGTDATLGATDYIFTEQIIEGTAIGDFNYGLSTATTTVLSFWVNSSLTGTYCVFLSNSANNRNYVAEYTISSANTWEKKSVTIPGDVTGTWANTEGSVGLGVGFTLMAGSTQQQTAGSWTANSSRYGSANQVNWAANASATFYLTGVQLEIGSVPTSFEWDDINVEYEKVQRFYQKSYPRGTAIGSVDDSSCLTAFSAAGSANTTSRQGRPFAVTMYGTPTIKVYSAYVGTLGKVSNGASGADEGGTVASASVTNKAIGFVTGTGFTAGIGAMYHYTADTGF